MNPDVKRIHLSEAFELFRHSIMIYNGTSGENVDTHTHTQPCPESDD